MYASPFFGGIVAVLSACLDAVAEERGSPQVGGLGVCEPEVPAVDVVDYFLAHAEGADVFGGGGVGHRLVVLLLGVEEQVPAVRRLRSSVGEVQTATEGSCLLGPLRHVYIGPVEQVPVDVPGVHGLGVVFRRLVGVEDGRHGRVVGLVHADDDDVDVCHVGGLGVPSEGAVGESYAPAVADNRFEQGGDWHSLGDAVRGHERELRVRLGEVLAGLAVPSGGVIEVSVVVLAPDDPHVLSLVLALQALSDKWRVAP